MASLRRLYLFLAAVYLLTSSLLVPQALAAPGPLYLSFTVPGSVATYPLSINKDLTITGYYIDKSGKTHGFVRCIDGQISTFDVPGSVLTKPVSINAAGEITGYYEIADSGGPSTLGFTRKRDGAITTFGTTAFPSFLAQPVAINNAGEVVGNFPQAGLGSEAFVRSSTGTVQTFSITIGAAYSTFLTAVNAHGAVVGYGGSDDLAFAQGLLWNGQPPTPSPGAGFTEISFPGSTGTFPTGINKRGEIVGCYSIGSVYYDFLRAADGTFTTINPPGTVPSCLATSDTTVPGLYHLLPASVSLNNRGTLIGYTTNAAVTNGFVRFPDGTIVPFAIPGSSLTIPASSTSLDGLDILTGYYTKGTRTEGFIALP
jgi:hypothetical protein